MRKVTLIFAIFLMFLSANAQEKTKNIVRNFQLNLGVTLGDYSFKSDQGKVDYKPQVGFRIGADNVFFTKNKFSLESGLTFSWLRTKVDEPTIKIDYSSFYVGTHLVGNYAIYQDKLFIGAGPFIDFGLFGTQKPEGSESIDLFVGKDGNDAPLKRLNYGVDFRLLGDISSTYPIQAYVSYRLGIPNIEGADGGSGQTFKASIISFGVRANLHKIFEKKSE
ncbi:outer membrane beta-barrel protein [Flavobacterium haoranii]|uniref:Outer membrane protein beta-barrel domain-containing protein n=1 Tax=Flavobacterium haoranii TaxID=683124 RepID=A0A1M6EKC4_9FLAO|nr:outer membrane beta-barrel protein [Flavobacterium haoranii]SHI85879.1 Outer membrane protein beta-barrel domain-containing protein [Flavobacterium haoranii]